MADKNFVIIKSFKNGLRLILDNNAPFNDIIDELSYKCNEGRTFFGKAITAISIEGRDLSEDDEVEIIKTINNNCDLNVICIVGKEDTVTESVYYKAIELMQSRLADESNDSTCTIYHGNLKNGDSIESDKPVIVVGDVEPGCSISSSDSIFVIGGMYGEALIKKKSLQSESNKSYFVFAIDMMPERIEINDTVYRFDSKGKWAHKHKFATRFAIVKSGKIVLEEVNRSVLETIYAL